jgi:hypothetical protein
MALVSQRISGMEFDGPRPRAVADAAGYGIDTIMLNNGTVAAGGTGQTIAA